MKGVCYSLMNQVRRLSFFLGLDPAINHNNIYNNHIHIYNIYWVLCN